MHGPDEVAFTCELFSQVEDVLGLPQATLKVGIMDEERRTTVNLKACIKAAARPGRVHQHRFSGSHRRRDPHVDGSGPDDPQGAMKSTTWIKAYEDNNVDTGARRRLQGQGSDRQGMWAMTELMADMVEQKIGQPKAGATTAWVPSPTAGNPACDALPLRECGRRGRRNSEGKKRTTIDELLTIPLAKEIGVGPRRRSAREVDNNCQSILGYVVRLDRRGSRLLEGSRHPQRRVDGRPCHTKDFQPAAG